MAVTRSKHNHFVSLGEAGWKIMNYGYGIFCNPTKSIQSANKRKLTPKKTTSWVDVLDYLLGG